MPVVEEPEEEGEGQPRSRWSAVRTELAVVGGYLATFLVLNWRLFAVGNPNQLYLYGDNLSSFNNLYYTFSRFRITDVFSTYVGTHGMLGSYPMAEPQNSVFYPPLLVMGLVVRLFNVGSVGLYYLLLANHTLHAVIGAYLVYRICRLFSAEHGHSLLGGLVYLGLGWNAGWFGTNTLSYMVALVPLTTLLFLRYMRRPSRSSFCWLVAGMAVFLLGGGLVNYFFYLLLNLGLIALAAHVLRLVGLAPALSRRESIRRSGAALIIAPIWALSIYAVQLVATAYVSHDITHAASGYDALALFGSHLSDLIGVILPKFGLIGFGSTTNPKLISDYLGANLVYVGLMPLMVVTIALLSVRSRMTYVLAGLAGLNLFLAFGGMFPLYDLTLLVPGNARFRGHYKYLSFVGLYLAVLTPLALTRIAQGRADATRYSRAVAVGAGTLLALFCVAMVVGVSALAVHVVHDPDLQQYSPTLDSVTNSLFHTVLLAAMALALVHAFVRAPTKTCVVAIGLVAVLDTSVNYKFATYYATPIRDLTSSALFSCCKDLTVMNDLEGKSQVYLIPEVVGVDPVFFYTAIPNKYLVDFSSRLIDRIGNPNHNYFVAGGIDGLLTDHPVSLADFPLAADHKLGSADVRRYYHYNPDGGIHDNWGGGPNQIGAHIRFYRANGSRQFYVSPTFAVVANGDAALHYLETTSHPEIPVVESDGPSPSLALPGRPHEARIVRESPTSKTFDVNAPAGSLLFVNIPYSRIWRAEVNGNRAPVERTNYAFTGVRLDGDGKATVHLFVNKRPLELGLAWSIVSVAALVMFGLAGRSRRVVRAAAFDHGP